VGEDVHDKILQVIKEIVKSRFPDANILSVKVAADESSDGGRVLNVTVVFESASGSIDPHRAAGLIRHTRPKLREAGEEAFPIFSFMTKSDAEIAGAAA